MTTRETDTPPQLLSIVETARLLNVSKSTAYRLVWGGEVPALRIGRQIRISAAELEDYVYDKGVH